MTPLRRGSVHPRYVLSLIVLAMLAGAAPSACAQAADTSHAVEPAKRIQIVSRILYQPTWVRLNDGTRYSGRISGMQGDSLLLLVSGLERRIPLPTIASLEIEGVKPETWRAGVAGAFIGAYLATALFGTPEDQPFAYAEWEDLSYVAVAVGFAVPGYLLFDALSRSWTDHDFTFEGDQDHRREEQQRFQDFVAGTPREPRLHARIFGGAISTRRQGAANATNTYDDNQYRYPWGYGNEAPRINLFRTISLTLSLGSWLEVGIALANMSEPSYHLVRGSDPNTEPVTDTYDESFRGTLYAAFAAADPLRSTLPGWLRWKVQAGVGFAGLSLESMFYGSSDPPMRAYQLDKTAVGGLIGTSLEIFITNEVSIGIGADYAICPGEEFPEVPEFGLTSKPIGNACIGFTFGIHL